MRNYYLLLIILFPFFLNAQIINIPDANFKNKLLSANVDNNIASQNVNINGTPSFFNKIDKMFALRDFKNKLERELPANAENSHEVRKQ